MQLKDNRVWLDATRLWVDAWAFEELSQRARQLPGASSELWRALSLYRGQFLPDDADAVWALSTRERLRDRFVSCIGALGRHFEGAGDPTGRSTATVAASMPTIWSEPFYQGLMRCYGALGMAAEGMMAYRRMHESLTVVRRTRPSPESEALYRRLSADRGHL